MSKAARLLSQRPLILSSSSTQSLCRRSTLDSLVRPTRQRLLYTTRPLCATIVTSATSFSPSLSSVSPAMGSQPTVEVGGSSRPQGDARMERAEVLRRPTKEDIEEAELDAEVLPTEECNVLVTERAAEVCLLWNFLYWLSHSNVRFMCGG